LYFKDQFEITQAVVTNLRSNGFWAYIPKFDFRAPVYLSDRNGTLQIDPGLLELNASAGLDPTAGFASSGTTRRFPSGTCTLFDSLDDDHLEVAVTVSDTVKSYQVRVLDVVTVNIFCDEWDTKARVPQPRIHLIADSSQKKMASSQNLLKLSVGEAVRYDCEKCSSPKTGVETSNQREGKLPPSLYHEAQKLETPPNLNVEFRSLESKSTAETKSQLPSSKILIPGRIIFGNFVNPDTRSAQQDASIKEASAAALERRNQALANRTKESEYDITRKIESSATARMQRLAASKRNARKGKST